MWSLNGVLDIKYYEERKTKCPPDLGGTVGFLEKRKDLQESEELGR